MVHGSWVVAWGTWDVVALVELEGIDWVGIVHRYRARDLGPSVNAIVDVIQVLVAGESQVVKTPLLVHRYKEASDLWDEDGDRGTSFGVVHEHSRLHQSSRRYPNQQGEADNSCFRQVLDRIGMVFEAPRKGRCAVVMDQQNFYAWIVEELG